MKSVSNECRVENMEILRLLQRACNNNIELNKKAILACNGLEPFTPQLSAVLALTIKDVEVLEGQKISEEELIKRIKEADPKKKIDIEKS